MNLQHNQNTFYNYVYCDPRDLCGQFVAEFPSTHNAQKILGSGITAHLQGRTSLARGSIWIFKRDYEKSENKNELITSKLLAIKPGALIRL